VGNARGYRQLRVDGEMLSTVQWRVSIASRTHIELPVNQIQRAATAPTCSEQRHSRVDMGKGLVHVLILDSTAKKPKVQVFSIKRAAFLRHEFSELDPRLFSFNSKHGWCEDCLAPASRSRASTEQSGEGNRLERMARREAHAARPAMANA